MNFSNSALGAMYKTMNFFIYSSSSKLGLPAFDGAEIKIVGLTPGPG